MSQADTGIKRYDRTIPSRKPVIGFYTSTFQHRSETFFYRQASGMSRVNAQILACWGANLDEFQIQPLYLVEEYRRVGARMRSSIRRRLDRSASTMSRLPKHAVRALARHLSQSPVNALYTIFGWHATQLLDVLDELGYPIPMIYLAAGSDVLVPELIDPDYLDRLHRVFDRSALILSASSFLRDRLIELGAPAEKVQVHYLGVEQVPVIYTSEHSSGPFTILAVSRLTSFKGLPHTIRAFSKVAEIVPDARLLIIGDGEERPRLESLMNDLDLTDRVTLAGSQSLSEVYAAMSKADVFVQHSIRTAQGQDEGLGVSILEAAAHGLPVVATRSGGIPETVVDGETGILVEPGDEDAMVRALVALAEDPKRRHHMGARGRDRVERLFNIHTLNRELEDIFLKLSGRH